MTTPITKPDHLELAAAIAGLMKARATHQWQGIRPEGSGQNDAAEPIVVSERGDPVEEIKATMSAAQTRWPDATEWEVIGADSDKWAGTQTFAEFSWPAADQAS